MVDIAPAVPSPTDRWTGGTKESGLYTADRRLAAYAEYIKHKEMTGIDPFETLPGGTRILVKIGSCKVDTTEFLDACDSTFMADLGVTRSSYIIDYDNVITAAVAFSSPRAAWQVALNRDKKGLIGPSAAYDGANTVLIRSSAIGDVVSDLTIKVTEVPEVFKGDPRRRKGKPLL